MINQLKFPEWFDEILDVLETDNVHDKIEVTAEPNMLSRKYEIVCSRDGIASIELWVYKNKNIFEEDMKYYALTPNTKPRIIGEAYVILKPNLSTYFDSIADTIREEVDRQIISELNRMADELRSIDS